MLSLSSNSDRKKSAAISIVGYSMLLVQWRNLRNAAGFGTCHFAFCVSREILHSAVH